jgi:signal transduction histidine kinase
MQARVEELALQAMDTLPQAVLIVDRRGGILFRNRAAGLLLPSGDDVTSVLHSPSGAHIDWQGDMDALDGEPFGLTSRNVSLGGRGNRQLLADVYLRRLRSGKSEKGELPSHAQAVAGGEGVLIVVEDVSSRASMERRLAASERLAAVGKVAAKVAHELNNPLDGVLRYIGMAQRLSGEEANKHLSGARGGLMRMVAVIRDLLDHGRSSHGVPRAAVEKLLEEAVATFQARAQATGVTFACEISDGAGIIADGNLFQVFCNIIKNALDAMPEGGVLTIRLRRDCDRCRVEFSDTGYGLTAEQARRAFEPFYTTKPPGQGTGLGLSICREIVAVAGGEIGIAPRDGGGVIVSINLPLQADSSLSGLPSQA